MEKKTLYFKADNQSLVGQNVPARLASDTVSYIEAVFDLGENWSGFDAVKAVWSTDFDSLCTVLDSSGACVVPHEVLERVGDVWVNLVGSISEDETLTDRLTTYPIKAVVVDANAAVCGSETSPVTPSQFDQFVEAVRADADRAEEGATEAAASASAAATSAAWSDERATDSSNAAYTATNARAEAERWASEANRAQYYAWQEAENAGTSARDAEEAKDTILSMTATATTLPEGSQATVDYNNGVMAFGIPRGDKGAKGDKGETGETGATPQMSIGTVETLAPDEDATATITGTAENPVLSFGIPKGETGEVSKSELASLMPLETVSGSVASFSDGSAVFDAEQALVSLEPIQSGSGTPSPDNVRPISGHDSANVAVAGKNLLPLQTNAFQPLYIKAGTQIFVSADSPVDTHESVFSFFRADGTRIDYWTLTVPVGDGRIGRAITITEDTYYVAITNATAYNKQIELGSTATPYEPYQGETYTTSLGQTVYGGTVDLVSGVLTVERAMVTLDGSNDEQWTVGEHGTHYRGYTYVLSDIKPHQSISQPTSAICDKLETGNWENVFTGVFVLGQTGKAIGFGLDSLGITNIADLNAWLTNNPITICYELATPQTYQLTPQAIELLTGDNNVWSEDGQIQVKYRANIGLYVDKKISEVSQ